MQDRYFDDQFGGYGDDLENWDDNGNHAYVIYLFSPLS